MSDTEGTTEAGETTEAPKATKGSTARAASHCSIEGCKRPYRAKGYCNVHYSAWRTGEMEGHRNRYKTCTKEGCRKRRHIGSVCEEHAGKKD